MMNHWQRMSQLSIRPSYFCLDDMLRTVLEGIRDGFAYLHGSYYEKRAAFLEPFRSLLI